MSETMIPTMSFRWLVPSLAAYGAQPNCRRLQQLHHTNNGDRWIDVRMVEEQPTMCMAISPETQRALDEIDANIRTAARMANATFVD